MSQYLENFSPATPCRSGRNPSQRYHELRAFMQLLHNKHVSSYLEIGARHGDTFYHVMRSLPLGSVGVAVDFPGGKWGTVKSQQHLIHASVELRQLGYRTDVIFGDSTDPTIIEEVGAHGIFDAVFIDGDHRYGGVKADWINYSPMAHLLVGFHDIDGHGQFERVANPSPVEVPKLWEELKAEYPDRSIEFIDKEHRGMGIGVVMMP